MKRILLMTLILTLLLMGCVSTNKEDSMTTKVQLIRNATMKIEYGGMTFLTDPMFAQKESLPGFLNNDVLANPTVDIPVDYKALLEGIDTIVVSHTHIPSEDVPTLPSDHFDPLAIEAIEKDMAIYVQPFDQVGLNRVGFTNVTSIDDSLAINGVKVTRIIGRHVDLDPLLPMIGESSGYVFEKEGYPTMLWTGDTILTDDIKSSIEKYQPEIIIVHAGGAQLPIDAEGNMATLLMDDNAAIEVAKLAPNAKIIAVHLEALDHCPVTREGLRQKANEANIAEDRLLIPADGETIDL